jgi:hypothetical protein
MLRAGLVLGACFLVSLLRGQEVVLFDSAYVNGGGGFAFGVSVFEVDSGYRVFGVQRAFAAPTQDLYCTRYDSLGRTVDERVLSTPVIDWMGRYSPIRALGSNYYAGVARALPGNIMDSLFLYKFDRFGDTAWTRLIDVDTTFLMRGFTLTRSLKLMISGLHELPEEAYVYVLDTLGTALAYHAFQNFDPEDVEEGKDGRIYVAGVGSVAANYGRSVLICSDTLGTELWRRTDTTYGNHYQLIASQDSGVIALGWRSEADTPERAEVIKYNKFGVQQWLREPYAATYDEWPCYLHAGFENPDGSFIVAGWLRDTIHGQAGMLFHLDSQGHTVWQRFYAHYPSYSFGDDQIFYDVKRTRDGGLVLTGETNGGDFPYAQLWLLKLDSLGCLVPGCQNVGVEEYTDLFQGKLVVRPNPASDQVRVSLALSEGFATQGVVHLYVMDTQGRIVGREVAQSNLNMIAGTVDVRGLAGGTYYLHVADSKRWLAGGELIVAP